MHPQSDTYGKAHNVPEGSGHASSGSHAAYTGQKHGSLMTEPEEMKENLIDREKRKLKEEMQGMVTSGKKKFTNFALRRDIHESVMGAEKMQQFNNKFHEIKDHQVNTVERLAENRVREKEVETYLMDDWGQKHLGVHRFALMFDALSVVAVTANAVVIARTTNMSAEGKDISGPPWTYMEHTFCLIYILEFMFRLHILGRKFFNSIPYCLDLGIIVLTTLDTWILPILGKDSGHFQGKTVSVARLFRLLRLMRLFKVTTAFRSVWLLIIGFAQSLRILLGAMTILGLVVFASAVWITRNITEMANETPQDIIALLEEGLDVKAKLGNVQNSMWTLFGCVVEGCFEDVYTPIVRVRPEFVAFAFIFTFVTFFGLLNLLVGIFCETCLETARKELSIAENALSKRQSVEIHLFREMWMELDKDGQGFFTLDDFDRAMEIPRVMEALEQLELADFHAGELFANLDVSFNGRVTMDEFLKGMLRLSSTGINDHAIFLCVRRTESSNAVRDEKLDLLIRNQNQLSENHAVLHRDLSRCIDCINRLNQDVSARLLLSHHERDFQIAWGNADYGGALKPDDSVLALPSRNESAASALEPAAPSFPATSAKLVQSSSKAVQTASPAAPPVAYVPGALAGPPMTNDFQRSEHPKNRPLLPGRLELQRSPSPQDRGRAPAPSTHQNRGEPPPRMRQMSPPPPAPPPVTARYMRERSVPPPVDPGAEMHQGPRAPPPPEALPLPPGEREAVPRLPADRMRGSAEMGRSSARSSRRDAMEA